MGVKDPYIEVGLLEYPTPHSVCGDIEPRPILTVSGSSRELVGRHWLQVWFDAHLTTYFCEKIGHEIANLVLPNGRKPSFGTRECMVYGVVVTAVTFGWEV